MLLLDFTISIESNVDASRIFLETDVEHNPVVVKILLRHFLKEFTLRDDIYTGLFRWKNASCWCRPPENPVETQAHLSVSNIDREASPSFTLSLSVAFLPLSTRFVPPYIPHIVSMYQRSFRGQTRAMRDNASHF